MKPKLKYVIEPINATPEQSFPPRNSVGKASCCVSSSRGREFSGLATKLNISGRDARGICESARGTATVAWR
jgi:hypothetical protein